MTLKEFVILASKNKNFYAMNDIFYDYLYRYSLVERVTKGSYEPRDFPIDLRLVNKFKQPVNKTSLFSFVKNFLRFEFVTDSDIFSDYFIFSLLRYEARHLLTDFDIKYLTKRLDTLTPIVEPKLGKILDKVELSTFDRKLERYLLSVYSLDAWRKPKYCDKVIKNGIMFRYRDNAFVSEGGELIIVTDTENFGLFSYSDPYYGGTCKIYINRNGGMDIVGALTEVDISIERISYEVYKKRLIFG